ncbi:hypothetical protein [uncultured Friedmanniella sp.]|uniref:hypothetical protein n=1 Tax=uncultured Friedmanniella sp. TaxID=335381 RepID=UPI0035CA093F
MRDEEYPADQIGTYGAGEQPAVAARMTPHLRLTQTGTVAAGLAVVVSAVAVASFPRFTTEATGVGWAVFALVCAVLMLGICVVQLVAWRQAMAWWRGQRSTPPAPLAPVSWWLHVASYLVALAALYACIAGSRTAGWTATAATLLAVALLLVLAGQVLGAVQYVRPDGPPGTVPMHLRRLFARERARQQAAAAIVERDSPRG